MTILKKLKTYQIISAALLCIAGLAFIIWPNISAEVVCYIAGSVLIISGLYRIWSYFSGRTLSAVFGFGFAEGIFLIAVGILLLIHPAQILSIMPFVIGMTVLAEGIFILQTSFDAIRFGIGSWWTILIASLLSIAAGVVLMVCGDSNLTVLVEICGVSLILDGIDNAVCAAYTSRFTRDIKDAIQR